MQTLDEKVWLAVEVGWKKPSDSFATGDDGKIKIANFNSRVLNALFSSVTNEEFKKISSTEIMWMILLTITWHLSLINKWVSHSHFNSLPKKFIKVIKYKNIADNSIYFWPNLAKKKSPNDSFSS